jgi:hypothetical protein
MSQESTDRLVSFLESDPEYLMAFMADFGGKPSAYIESHSGGPFDFRQLTPTQIGQALRQFVLELPPPELADLDGADVDWAAIGGRIDDIVVASVGDL